MPKIAKRINMAHSIILNDYKDRLKVSGME